MLNPVRKRELRRTLFLVKRINTPEVESSTAACYAAEPRAESLSGLRLFLFQSGLSISPLLFCAASVFCAAALAYISGRWLSLYFVPFYLGLGGCIPSIVVARFCRKRAEIFSADYPAVLLAAASSIKVGLTPYQALERATKLLPKDSLVSLEVRTFLDKMRAGYSRHRAIREFAESIRQPDLELFRSALLLVLENGGRFSPTLSRLAAVSNNRAQLIRSAGVSTASMRMTANIILFIAPVLTFLTAIRTEKYWDIFFHHPAANFMASAGIVLITVCYALLRHLSNFKP